MKYLQGLLVVLLFLSLSCTQNETNAVSELQALIKSYEDHEGYDEDEYPLGLFTAEYFGKEAEFAKTKLKELSGIDRSGLSETEKISAELLAFVLQDKIDFYDFERYLNPLLSDAGFHLDLPYEVIPLADYKKTRAYLNTLNALPEFVDQHIANLREGLKKGKSAPRVIFNGYESTF